MKLPIIRSIRREDIASSGGEIPPWMDKLLGPLNQFIEQVGVAVTGKLSVGDNLAQKYLTQTLSDGVELEVNPNDRRRVVGLIPVFCADKLVTGFGFSYKNDGNIGVTVKFDSAGSSEVKLLLLFE